MDASSIQVLQRDSGYLRVQLPPPLRSVAIGAALESGLKSLPGVQRTTWLTTEGKLAIRFDAHACTHADVARRIKALLAELPQDEPLASVPAAETEPAEAKPGIAERIDEVREKFISAAPARFRPLVESATTEKAITNFTNDIVVFYLIKTHWDLITKLWLKDPVKYSNAWLTVFYLVFLLVRYRKS